MAKNEERDAEKLYRRPSQTLVSDNDRATWSEMTFGNDGRERPSILAKRSVPGSREIILVRLVRARLHQRVLLLLEGCDQTVAPGDRRADPTLREFSLSADGF